LADLLLAPTQVAVDHLRAEGLTDRVVLVGDVMMDVCLATRDAVADQPVTLPSGVDADAPFVLATIHRADNTDGPDRLAAILGALASAPVPVVLLAHPRLVAMAARHGLPLTVGSLVASEPLAYPQMVRAIMASAGVVTDSGGLQKEAFLLEAPTTTIRTETEWVETLVDGWNILDPGLVRLHEVMARPRPTAPRGAPYGDGHAAEHAVRAIVDA